MSLESPSDCVVLRYVSNNDNVNTTLRLWGLSSCWPVAQEKGEEILVLLPWGMTPRVRAHSTPLLYPVVLLGRELISLLGDRKDAELPGGQARASQLVDGRADKRPVGSDDNHRHRRASERERASARNIGLRHVCSGGFG